MKDDFTGKHLATLLSNKKSVKIETTEGNWIRDFYLPKYEQLAQQRQKRTATLNQNERLIVFFANSGYHSIIHYNDKTLKLTRGDKAAFKIVKGRWETLDDTKGKNIT